jgi:hypothetical protein
MFILSFQGRWPALASGGLSGSASSTCTICDSLTRVRWTTKSGGGSASPIPSMGSTVGSTARPEPTPESGTRRRRRGSVDASAQDGLAKRRRLFPGPRVTATWAWSRSGLQPNHAERSPSKPPNGPTDGLQWTRASRICQPTIFGGGRGASFEDRSSVPRAGDVARRLPSGFIACADLPTRGDEYGPASSPRDDVSSRPIRKESQTLSMVRSVVYCATVAAPDVWGACRRAATAGAGAINAAWMRSIRCRTGRMKRASPNQ